MYRLDPTQTKQDVERILTNEISGEYSWLDFKMEYSRNSQDLIHDIICLSNTRHNGTRYMIYGVKNSTWELKGLTVDLVSHDIYTLVNGRIWNHRPEILVDHITLGKLRFGYIAIANSPTKPHFLRKGYKGIPASAIYTRQGDTNTPFRSGTEIKAIEDGELETMFRERLGIDKPLSERVEILLAQTEKWQDFTQVQHFEQSISYEHSGYFHQDFPEYQIQFFYPEDTRADHSESWVQSDPSERSKSQAKSNFSRVQGSTKFLSRGKEFDICVHSTPVFQEGDLIKLDKTYCPYPILNKDDSRYHIETNESERRNSRFNYYVGAILFLRNKGWFHHSDSEPKGEEIFTTYDSVIRSSIDETRSDRSKESMLLLTQRINSSS